MEIIKSNKGGLKMCMDGYMYTKLSVKSSSIFWKCSQKVVLSCKAVLRTGFDISFLFDIN